MQLAADANVLLAAVLGGRAGQNRDVELVTTGFTFSEVAEYATLLARKKRLPLDTIHLQLAALPVLVIDRGIYVREIPRARALIAHRDPDDVELLALALHLKIPVWSNDSDFEETDVEWYTTARLLNLLGLTPHR